MYNHLFTLPVMYYKHNEMVVGQAAFFLCYAVTAFTRAFMQTVCVSLIGGLLGFLQLRILGRFSATHSMIIRLLSNILVSLSSACVLDSLINFLIDFYALGCFD